MFSRFDYTGRYGLKNCLLNIRNYQGVRLQDGTHGVLEVYRDGNSYECLDIAIEVAMEENGSIAEAKIITPGLDRLFQRHYVAIINGKIVDLTPAFVGRNVEYEVEEDSIKEPTEIRRVVPIPLNTGVVYNYDKQCGILSFIFFSFPEEDVGLILKHIESGEELIYQHGDNRISGGIIDKLKRGKVDASNPILMMFREKIREEKPNLEVILNNFRSVLPLYY